ncbi:replication-relaxation family protein, partial [Parvibaculum sp.]|uniref:replication-relaxation family protein n=1 Tax=Parvibaculum sp. TaxID=2024848 RepID=UPI003299AD9F
MKTHDALGRRDRYKRIPSLTEADSPLVPNQGDIAMIEAIHHHGPLSSIYLPEFRKPHGVSRQVAVRRLNFLFNETRAVDGGAYLSRPLHQTRTEYAHSKHLVYDLTPASEKLLKRLGKWSASAPSSRNPWTHAFMVSSITASIDLACRRAGLSFIPGHELLDRAETTLRQTVGFKWKGRELTVDLTPDALFAIDYGGKYRVFMVEADRGTEPILTSTASRKSIYRNLLQYRAFVGEGVYQKAYKLQARA